MDNPLAPSAEVPAVVPTEPQRASDWEGELRVAQDPDALLARWCLEGRPRITAALAEEGSVVRLAAQLLSEANVKSFAAAGSAQDVLAGALRAGFAYKFGQTGVALDLLRGLLRDRAGELSPAWRRRIHACMGWMLVSSGDLRAGLRIVQVELDLMMAEVRGETEAQTETETEAEDDHDHERFALRIALARLCAEVGDPKGARREWNAAVQAAPKLANAKGDARVILADARICFAEGDIASAASRWHGQSSVPVPRSVFPPSPKESVASWLTAFAMAAVVGDLGDYIVKGSRWARHEAANNFAVCALNTGRLDDAVAALEEVMRNFGAPAVVDSVSLGNLKTLYELTRTPDHLRIVR